MNILNRLIYYVIKYNVYEFNFKYARYIINKILLYYVITAYNDINNFITNTRGSSC